MENQNESIQSEIIDLGFNVEDVDLSRPVMKPGRKRFTVVSTTKVPTKTDNEDGSKYNLQVVFSLDEEAESTKKDDSGATRMIHPGFKLTQSLPLQDSGKMSKDQWKERPTQLHRAITGEKGGINTGAWQNKTVILDITVKPKSTGKDGKEYPEGNDIKGYYPVPENQNAAK
jgi:hypothetical protein